MLADQKAVAHGGRRGADGTVRGAAARRQKRDDRASPSRDAASRPRPPIPAPGTFAASRRAISSATSTPTSRSTGPDTPCTSRACCAGASAARCCRSTATERRGRRRRHQRQGAAAASRPGRRVRRRHGVVHRARRRRRSATTRSASPAATSRPRARSRCRNTASPSSTSRSRRRRGSCVQGGEATATIAARYYFGQPVAGASRALRRLPAAVLLAAALTDGFDGGESGRTGLRRRSASSKGRRGSTHREAARSRVATRRSTRTARLHARIEARVTDASGREVSGARVGARHRRTLPRSRARRPVRLRAGEHGRRSTSARSTTSATPQAGRAASRVRSSGSTTRRLLQRAADHDDLRRRRHDRRRGTRDLDASTLPDKPGSYPRPRHRADRRPRRSTTDA